MRAVRLYGELGRKFGRVHRLKVSSPAEAIRALRANFPGFERHLVESESRGVGYRVKNGPFELASEREVSDPAAGDIRIIPAVIGANAEFRVLIGAALVVAAVFAAPFTAGTSLAFIPSVIGGIGASLALGGIAQMISPPPPTTEPSERPENKPSYVFNGPVNTTAQGQPVPIGYGKLIVGGAVISAGIRVEQLKPGFTRTKTESSKEISFKTGTSEIYPAFQKIPSNYFKRVFNRTDTVLMVAVDVYDYFYYEWTVVPG